MPIIGRLPWTHHMLRKICHIKLPNFYGDYCLACALKRVLIILISVVLENFALSLFDVISREIS